MLSALSKMAARNCIFVKCFLKKTRKSTPLQLNFECSGAFWLNLVTLHCEPVRTLVWQSPGYLDCPKGMHAVFTPQGTFASLQGAVAPALPSYYNYCLLVMSPLQSRYFSTFSSFPVESFCEKTDFLSFSTRFIHRSFTICGFFFVIFPGHEVVFPLVAVSFCV